MTLAKHKFLFISIVIITVSLGICSSFFLPEKYYYDANLIALDPYNEKGLIGSYPFSMWFYENSKLNKLSYPLIALVQLPIIFFLIKKIGIPRIFNKLYLRNLIMWLSLIILAVYLSIPSKEFINLIYISLIVFIFKSSIKLNLKLIIIFLMFLFFGAWFRAYYALIPVLAIGISGLIKIKINNRIFFNILTGLLIACFLSLSYGFIKGKFMSEGTREALNFKRLGREDSQTLILSPLKTDNYIGESVGIFYGFFSVNFPVNGLKFFYKPQVLAFVFWQLILFIYILYNYSQCLSQPRRYKNELWVFHFIISYFIIQGVFEPDLGSAIKHKLGVLPLIYLAIYYDQNLLNFSGKKNRYVIKI